MKLCLPQTRLSLRSTDLFRPSTKFNRSVRKLCLPTRKLCFTTTKFRLPPRKFCSRRIKLCHRSKDFCCPSTKFRPRQPRVVYRQPSSNGTEEHARQEALTAANKPSVCRCEEYGQLKVIRT